MIAGEDEADEGQPQEERSRQDLRVLGPGRLRHQPRARLAVAESDRLEDGHGEVDPEGLQRQERHAAEDVEDAGAEERGDEPEQARHLEPDVAHQVVVQGTALFDGAHDRREVVVRQDHHRGLLGDLGPGDAHGHADVGHLERRRVVHAVARHRHDMALAAEDLDQPDLVLRSDPGDDADVIDGGVGLVVGHRRELGAGDRPAHDPELAGDGLGGHRVIAGDHPDLDAGRVRLGDGVARLGAWRVDDADEGEELEVGHGRQQIGVRVEGRRVEVPLGGGQDPQALRAELLVLGQVRGLDLVHRVALPSGPRAVEARARSWSGRP